MARGRFEQQLEELARLKAAGAGPEAERALRKALTNRNNYYVSKAASAVRELGLRQLVPELLATFNRFFSEEDPQCWAKNELARALGELGHDQPEPYLRGIRHVQMEPVWGGAEDSAGTLRGICALALTGCRGLRDIEILRELTRVLVDGDKTVRIEAVRAVARLGREEGSLLLRVRALGGDPEPEVLGAMYNALIGLEQAAGVAFVGEFLTRDPETAEEAALSLGESRLPEAFEMLRDKLENAELRHLRKAILTAIALTRLPEATAFLLDLIRRDARGAADAKHALLDYGALSESDRAALAQG